MTEAMNEHRLMPARFSGNIRFLHVDYIKPDSMSKPRADASLLNDAASSLLGEQEANMTLPK